MKNVSAKTRIGLKWCGAMGFAMLTLAGCAGAPDAATREANSKASLQPTPVPGLAPLSSRPPGVPADRPRFPGEPKR